MRVLRRKRCSTGAVIYTRVRYRVREPLGGRRFLRERFSTCPTATIRGGSRG